MGRRAYTFGQVRLRDLPVNVVGFLGLTAFGALAPTIARASGTPATTATPSPPSAPPAEGEEGPSSRLTEGHLQYGAALAIEIMAAAGPACPASTTVPCIFGSGGGLVVRTGYRFYGPVYLGGAYEFSKHDANKLLRLPIMQQLRGEMRFALPTRTSIEPYLTLGFGAVGYGSEFDVTTWGPLGMAGFGIEAQLSRTSVFTASFNYRPFYLRAWTDPAGQDRAASLVSFAGLEIGLEQRVPQEPAYP